MRSKQQYGKDTQQSNQVVYIKGYKFTKREIDVISCFICSRFSSISPFLSISARTVETHIHNIMLKLGCNSRERIIDFIEQSGALPLISRVAVPGLLPGQPSKNGTCHFHGIPLKHQ